MAEHPVSPKKLRLYFILAYCFIIVGYTSRLFVESKFPDFLSGIGTYTIFILAIYGWKFRIPFEEVFSGFLFQSKSRFRLLINLSVILIPILVLLFFWTIKQVFDC